MRPRVLLTNDDGPPGEDSPYVFGFARHLAEDLGWEVKVVLPSSQKSWIGLVLSRSDAHYPYKPIIGILAGGAYHIKEITRGRYFYPRSPDGTGSTSISSRPVEARNGEFGEWVLIDGTPATCANIALNNLYTDSIDLVISGPNLGRNSSAAFALSSGTIGAALASSLSRCRSIAVSYGTVQKPVPPELFEPAHRLAGKIVQRLWQDWGAVAGDGPHIDGKIDLYNVNIPMANNLLDKEGMRVVWTTIWRNAYGRLFRQHEEAESSTRSPPPGGPDAVLDGSRLPNQPSPSQATSSTDVGGSLGASDYAPELVFKFAPDVHGLIGPSSDPPAGTDAWALEKGMASVTPLCASFAEPLGKSPAQIAESEGGTQHIKLFRL